MNKVEEYDFSCEEMFTGSLSNDYETFKGICQLSDSTALSQSNVIKEIDAIKCQDVCSIDLECTAVNHDGTKCIVYNNVLKDNI